MEFYTYLYLREDGTPYYVGKGKDRRAFHTRHNVPVPSNRERILIQEFPPEDDAIAAEIFLISYYGRKNNGTGILRNFTDGGDGTSGRKHLDDSKQQTRNALLGRKHTEERRKNQSLAHKGKSWTEAQRLGRANSSYVVSDETRKRQSESLKRAYAEGRRNSRFGATGHVVSDATRRKLSESNGVFTKTQIDEILRIRQTGISQRKIAEMFGVSRPTIGKICAGKSYRR
jgi:predicted XRE-type DNA-binding protein